MRYRSALGYRVAILLTLALALPAGAADYWVDAATPATYLQIQLDLLDGLGGEPVDGISPTARVDPRASVTRSVVMAGAEVMAGASVSDSVVSTGAQIRANAVVDGSVIGPGAQVCDGAKVTGLSVIGDGVVIGRGQVLEGAKIPGSG